MSDIVFILGAGASREAGAPTMPEFINSADRLFKTNLPPYVKPSFESVFLAISDLQDIASKSNIGLENIETIFSLFEMAKTLRRFPKRPDDFEFDVLIDSIKKLIVYTIEQKLVFPYSEGQKNKFGKMLGCPKPYDQFLLHVKELKKLPFIQTISFITFNYDLALDWTLFLISKDRQLDYGLKGRSDIPVFHEFPILKLHGSMNWVYLPSGDIEIIDIGRIDEFNGVEGFEQEKARVVLGSKLISIPSYSGLVITPPTWNKFEGQQKISSVWSRAAKELSEAEYIVVIGYSLPDTDYFFRYLYALGSVGRRILKRFIVVNPDEEVHNRFRNLLGLNAREKYEKINLSFSQAIDGKKILNSIRRE